MMGKAKAIWIPAATRGRKMLSCKEKVSPLLSRFSIAKLENALP